MAEIRLDVVGKMMRGDQKGCFIKVVDDSESTGGYLIFKCKNPQFEGEVFDSWAENWGFVELYFREWDWLIEWQ